MAHIDPRAPGDARLHARGALIGADGRSEAPNPARRLESLGGEAVRCLLDRIPLRRLRTGK